MSDRRPSDPAWLAPGQVATAKFPVVGERAPRPEALDHRRWRLWVRGAVQRPLDLTLADVLALPQEDVVCDVHCVTGWSRRATRFTGIRLAVLLERAGLRDEARFVRFEAYSPRAHDSSIPLDLALSDTWLVHSMGGGELAPEHGYPLRTLTPSRYLYKSVKWVHVVEVLEEDRLGFWERDRGYHNEADPWREQRYVTGDLKPSDLERFRVARQLDPFRGKLVVGADLAGWDPRDRDLRRLVLKDANLKGARLDGVDLREANLCRADLRGAVLCRADLRGTDLEGARLAGADLRDADLRDASLIATRFVGETGEAAARVRGMRWTSGPGLLEETEAFLRASDAAPPDPPRSG